MQKIPVGIYEKTYINKRRGAKEGVKAARIQKSDILVSALGFLVSRCRLLFGATPLGCAYLAAAFQKKLHYCLILFASVLIGNISGIIAFPIKYLMANFVFSLVFFFIKGEKEASPLLRATIMSACVFVCGLFYVALNGFLPYDILVLFLEAICVFAATAVFAKAVPAVKIMSSRAVLSKEEVLCVASLGAAVVASFSGLVLPFEISLQMVLSIYVSLLFSKAAGISITSAISVSLGFLMMLGDGGRESVMAAFVVASLGASVFGAYSSFASILAFWLFGCLTGLSVVYDAFGLIGFGELLMGTVLFLATPGAVFSYITNFLSNINTERSYSEKTKAVCGKKLQGIGEACADLSAAIRRLAAVKKPRNFGDVGTLFDMNADRVCKNCNMKFHCWDKDFSATYDMMTEMAGALKENGRIGIKEVPARFAARCGKIDEYIKSLNNLYETHKIDFMWRSKLAEEREAAAYQLSQVSGAIEGLTKSLLADIYFDADSEQKIKSELDFCGIRAQDVTVMIKGGGKTEVSLRICGCSSFGFCKVNIEPVISRALGKQMKTEEKACEKDSCTITFKDAPPFYVERAFAACPKEGEKVSGDSLCFIDSDDSFKMAISDGMGSGKSAKRLSETAINLLRSFLSAGTSAASAGKIINSALLLRDSEEAFVTLDISEVDLHSGEASFVKTGGAPTYIKRGKSVDKISSCSFPAGMFSNVDTEITKRRLFGGDYIIMVSDGVLDNGASDFWLVDALSFAQDMDAKELAEYVLSAARGRKKGKTDDITVLVAEICRDV